MLLSAQTGLNLTLILFLIAMAFVVIMLVGGILLYLTKKGNRSQAAWATISRNLGLIMPKPTWLAMTGSYNGLTVRVEVGVRRPMNRLESFTYCTADFPQNLALDLEIVSAARGLARILVSDTLRSGRPDLDDAFDMKCSGQDVLGRILHSDLPSTSSRNLGDDLMLARQNLQSISINDSRVYVEKSGHLADEANLRQMLDIATYLASRFWSAKSRLVENR